MRPPVDSLLFDLDETLCRYRRSTAVVLAEAFEAVGVEPFFAPADYYRIFDAFVAGSDSGRENRRRCFAELAIEAGRDPDLGREIADAVAAARDQTNVEWVPGASAALDELAPTYEVAVVTNGPPEWQRRKVRALGIDAAVELLLCAGYETAPKPDPEPFETALDRLDTPRERAVVIGNSLESDVAGANNAGIRSIWFDAGDGDQGSRTPDRRIESMGDLPDLLRGEFDGP